MSYACRPFARGVALSCAGFAALISSHSHSATGDLGSRLEAVPIVTYYEVTGNTYEEIAASIDRSMPTLPGTSERWEGVTKIELVFDPPLLSGAPCRPDALRLRGEITINVPRLAPTVKLSQADQNRWVIRERALFEHEEGHLVRGLEDAEDLMRKILSIPNATCADLEAMRVAAIRAMRARQAAYDTLTDHGNDQDALYRQGGTGPSAP
jgi:predicted secreted Zn-dependent protease